jgi:membrane protease YdiL (CAAX protease family)
MNNLNIQPRSIRWWHGILYFVAALSIHGVVLVVVALLDMFGLLGDNPKQTLISPLAISIQVLFTCTILTLLAAKIPKAYGHSPSKWLGLGRADLVVIVVSALGIIGMGFLVDEVVFIIHHLAPGMFSSSGLEMFNRVFVNASPVAFVLLTVVISIGPGIGEEFFFRGFMQRILGVDLPIWAAITLQAVLFGVLHVNMLQGAGAFLIGLYLGFVAFRTRSIWPCVVAHGLNNFLCSMFARFDPDATGQVWKTGHPPWMVISATLIAALSVITLIKLTGSKKAHKPA